MPKSEVQIFGTPPEPLFNYTVSGSTSELLQEWIECLIKANNKAVTMAESAMGCTISTTIIEFLFLTCEKLKMSSEVKYLAIDLFDRFMLQHMVDLHNHVMNSGSSKPHADWCETQKRVSNQVILRIISCVQIASKLTSHYKILSPNKTRHLLMAAGHKYSMESVLQSELRILKTLNFNVAQASSLVFMETLLEMIGRVDSDIEVKVLYGVTLRLLDMAYLKYDQLYDSLQYFTMGGADLTKKDKANFAPVRADKMLLLTTLITTATYIVDRDNHHKVMHLLSQCTHIPTQDITEFSCVILNIMSRSNTTP